MLKVTFEQLRRGASMPLGDCFRMERALIERCFTHGDMLEGIRALLIDKDNRPRWNPATLAEVTPAIVKSFFPEGTP
jgi:enoyl-CoA hydratase/carnithine racemase